MRERERKKERFSEETYKPITILMLGASNPLTQDFLGYF